ncbi:mycofactocin oligosaccharide methyltransferase MftM [Pseudonocardia sp. HH130630-07]|uniref:mycofactocin oligosaccharide methyltransferase MftM n=1 Tax=Pseudonocardia sp. HH130630-07 TaxID=1690815 RepID=UPI0009F5E3D7|nr:mycofactocin oligosaccharide methyltransferase MftM [Pseudonocardia sp. HH130630-07]
MIGTDRISNDLAGWLDRTLVAPGLLAPDRFEEAFVACVLGTADDPDEAWLAFYRNTLDALAGTPVPGGTNAETAPVHAMARSLAVGPDVLELGCCFGFLALQLARDGHRVTATDLTPGTVDLLTRVARPLGVGLTTRVADARSVPLPDRSADTVFAVHLVEHLDEADGARVLTEMLRLARRRVVVAVPFEDTPNPAWGHLRTFTPATLRTLLPPVGAPAQVTVTEWHGGWLVIDLDRADAGSAPPADRGRGAAATPTR